MASGGADVMVVSIPPLSRGLLAYQRMRYALLTPRAQAESMAHGALRFDKVAEAFRQVGTHALPALAGQSLVE